MNKTNGLTRLKMTGVGAICLAIAAMTPVAGGIAKGNGEIGVDFGSIELDSDFVEDRALGLMVRGGYFITDLLEVEGQLGSFFTTDLFRENVVFSTFLVNAVFNFRPTEHIVPYALGGVGFAMQDVDAAPGVRPDADTNDSASAYQVGGGSRFFLGKKKKFAVRAEITFLGENTFDRSSTHIRLLAGVTWRLGSRQ